jgi:imidazolonepropionase-like amidohydrolase
MNKLLAALCIAWMPLHIQAQPVPTPAPRQTQAIVLRNGIIHPGNGQKSAPGDLLIQDGMLLAIGAVTAPADAHVIDLKGQHVYPGLIAAVTQLGLEEVEAVRATRDNAEVGEINPNARAIVAFNTDSRVTPTVRSNGVLLAQVTPNGGLFSGMSSVVQLDAWTWEEAAYLPDDALHLAWPNMHLRTGRFAPPVEEQKKRLKETLDQLTKAMQDARAYAAAKSAGRLEQHDLRWEAMVPVLEGKKPVWVHAGTERQIRAAIAFALEHQIRMVLVGGQDAWLLKDLLKAHEIPVVLHQPHALPRSEDDDVDQPFKTAKMLHEAGVLVALSSEGFWQQRNLPFLAGTAAAHGLAPETALQLITSNPARILGIEQRAGSLEVGKDAHVIVTEGDLLDMRTSNVVWACVQGRVIDLGNHQKDLYKKFQTR